MPIDIPALDAVREDLEALHRRCEQGIVRPAEAQSALAGADRRVRELLPAESDPFRFYDRKFSEHRSLWWAQSITGYVERGDCQNILHRLEAVRAALTRLAPDFARDESSARAQFYFPEGDIYQARQTLFRLMKRAAARIDIVDPYLDPEVFEFLESIEPAVAVRLVTGAPKALFASQLRAFRANVRPVEARGIADVAKIHDRFLAIDGREIWHLGASINGLGRKASMINRVDEASERTRLLSDLEAWWSAGTPL